MHFSVKDRTLTRRGQGLTYHGSSSDIWSCGIILFALLTGRLPFDDENIRELLAKVKKGRYIMPPELPSQAQDLIHRMLHVDPEQRIKVRSADLQRTRAREADPGTGRWWTSKTTPGSDGCDRGCRT